VSHEHHQEPDRTQEPQPVRMSQQEFEDVVGDALDRIPADLAEVMDNVVVLVQDEPDPEMLTEEDYDDSGLPTLLGLYDGVPLTERDEGWSMVLPDRILIFRGPLARRGSRRAGERVPSVAVSSMEQQAQFREVTPMPIAWGTTDPTVIRTAIRNIPEASWDLLRTNMSRLDEVLATPRNLLPLD